MGVSRDNCHKRCMAGGKRNPVHKKRKYELGRPPANTTVSQGTTGINAARRVANAIPSTRSGSMSSDVLQQIQRYLKGQLA
ncbi:40S ribosomal protein S8-like [Clupea harengus]|uniref:40S ribosomal protein S8-like n=1 Tax=Clupea harengus TaxID=7950 RepID=A0A6P8EGU2_CLUHA|nr:40S ribosomal protein S8-like [Clupea harengus]